MWPFSRKKKEEPRRKRTVRRMLMGFIIGGAITSIIGNKVLQERRKHQLGEDKAE